MNALMSTSPRVDLRGLVDAIAQASADDAMTNPLSPAQWEVVAPYLQPTVFPASHTVFSQGAQDRTLYLVESGTLSVHYQDEKERLRLAIVGAGSVVGEGAFFSHRARSATVQARQTKPCFMNCILRSRASWPADRRCPAGCRPGSTHCHPP